MIDRRRFVSRLLGATGSVALGSCGGSGSTAELPTDGGAGGVPVSGGGTETGLAVGRHLCTVRLRATTPGTYPFGFGHAFRSGDLLPGQGLKDLQVAVLSRWPDGSARFGLIAGVVEVPTGGRTLDLITAGSASGKTLTTADLRATGMTAEVAAGSYGKAAWQAADWDAPARTWISGPLLSSWIYRRRLAQDTHLAAWLEVRLWLGGYVEVLPWIENGFVMAGGAASRSAPFRFVLAGMTRFEHEVDLPSRCRLPMVAGSRLSHWLASDLSVDVRHDAAYLMSTRVVPYFGEQVSDAAASRGSTELVPLEQGGYPNNMGAGGYHPSIGLLPSWDAMALANRSSFQPWRQVQLQAFRAGRFGIHFRDERTQQPARLSDWPTAVFGRGANIGDVGATTGPYAAVGTGTVPARFVTSHHPSLGFMAALLTGRFYHVETAQFVASINVLHQSPQYRDGGLGVLRTHSYIQARGMAWAMRSLAQAVVVTPDDDPLKEEFLSQLSATVRANFAQYVSRPNNPQGFMQVNLPGLADYSPGADPYHAAVWMLDFCTAAVGYAIDCVGSIGVDDSPLRAWFHWMAQSSVGRLGGTGPSEYLYRDAAQYTMAAAPSDRADWRGGKGPWYGSWGEVWAVSVDASLNPKVVGDGSLRNGFVGNIGSYWANLTPAIAYAVSHRVDGAAEAWARYTSAPNFGSGVAETFRQSPEWGVYPRPSG